MEQWVWVLPNQDGLVGTNRILRSSKHLVLAIFYCYMKSWETFCSAATTTTLPSATLILPRTTMKTSATLHPLGMMKFLMCRRIFSHVEHTQDQAQGFVSDYLYFPLSITYVWKNFFPCRAYSGWGTVFCLLSFLYYIEHNLHVEEFVFLVSWAFSN